MKKRYPFYISAGILILGLILGSIFDLKISEGIFQLKNGFGLVVSSFGMIPGYGTLAFMGGALCLIVRQRKELKFPIKFLLIFFAVTMYGVSVYFLGKDVFSVNGFDNKQLYWLGFVIMGILMVPLMFLGYYVAKRNDNPKMWIIILVMAAVIFVALVPGVTLFKSIMHRPRYRFAVHDGHVLFRYWWKPCKDYGDYITKSEGVLTKEEFKSFPSGHSGAAMVGCILLGYLPLYDKRLMKYQTLLFFIGFSWALVVMFARILVGAHYLSDTCFGALLTIICFYIGNEFVVRLLLPKEEQEKVIEQPVQE